jgi:two-component system, cell cycle response regulator DivK
METRPTILIIEDNADLVSILQLLLSEHFEVRSARTGEEGIDLAAEIHPDVVILDLQLPHMGGIEVGQRIKRDVGNVPILVLTALAGKGDPESILATGCCDAYMSKPTPLDMIHAKVNELLGTGRQAPS